MKIERQIDHIINTSLPALFTGEDSLESILARHPHISAELRPRLEAALWLQQVRLSVATRPGFIHDSRKYLETKIGSLQPIGFWHRIAWRYTPQRWVFNIATPVMLVLLLVLVIHDLVLTARLSMPGDPFYSTKLMIEDIQFALTFDQAEKTNQHIQLSRERALEFVQLVMKGDYAYLPITASRMETEIIASVQSLNNLSKNDPAIEMLMMANFKDSLSNELFMLNLLKRTSPDYASPGIELAIQAAQSGLIGLY